MIQAAEVVATARSYKGVRFQHQGRTRLGMDCAGLVVRVVHDLDLSTFDTRDYGKLPSGDRMRQVMREQCIELPPGADLVPGLVALMRFDAEPMHVAIVCDHPHGLGLVHALAASRKVTEHRLDQSWRNRVVGLYALPGVAY